MVTGDLIGQLDSLTKDLVGLVEAVDEYVESDRAMNATLHDLMMFCMAFECIYNVTLVETPFFDYMSG